MRRLNFATRVTVATTSKSDASGMHANKRAEVQAEINSHPVRIDRTVFQKTEAEKEILKAEKAHWNKITNGSH